LVLRHILGFICGLHKPINAYISYIHRPQYLVMLLYWACVCFVIISVITYVTVFISNGSVSGGHFHSSSFRQ